MKHQLVNTKNVTAFYAGLEQLKRGVRGRMGMMLLQGPPGAGKTFVMQKTAMQDGYVYVRCKFVDSPKSLLQAIVAELGEDPAGITPKLFQQALEQLVSLPRTLLLDEVDYATDHRFVEIIRDLNDMANTPIVIAGMGNIDKKLQRYPHFFDRLRAIVRFALFDAAEIKALAESLCEAALEDDAIAFVERESMGKFRLASDLLDLADRVARHGKLKSVNAAHLEPAWKKEKAKGGK